MRTSRLNELDLGRYIERFHEERPGVTEEVLGRSNSDGFTPYEWLSQAITPGLRGIDLGSGGVPLKLGCGAEAWVGVDRSLAELKLHPSRDDVERVQAEAQSLPFERAVFDRFRSSMAITFMSPISEVVSELARVTTIDAEGAFLLPAAWPFDFKDVLYNVRIKSRLRVIRFAPPLNGGIDMLLRSFARRGFEVVEKRSRRFEYVLEDEESCDRLLRSWYLPNLSESLVGHVRGLLFSRIGSSVGVPLMRVSLVRTGALRPVI
ncbi:Methyltransferase domain-containing protein [Ferrithrix thermotolerans DSM 19514]|uniref:Methyltransferase domain-containing protein n=1 Tax=Ferrithrix thermotolerans DSM 19514 TaxID=1121881 RepID=A0A1M4XPW5_9ACTN|nr:methyltransferase domain-containing protein [Ferrithrix thermotolerans]SHE95478.1 Methyltransferase domain-containing protein [Ferrithrix thermotolerans DSM 19514]